MDLAEWYEHKKCAEDPVALLELYLRKKQSMEQSNQPDLNKDELIASLLNQNAELIKLQQDAMIAHQQVLALFAKNGTM